MDKQQLLRNLPKVDILLQHAGIIELQQSFSRNIIVEAIREEIDSIREQIVSNKIDNAEVVSLDYISEQVAQRVKHKVKNNLIRTINGTGVVIHTNLGRSPLAKGAIEAINTTAANYSNLEIDVSTGQRGSRYSHIEDILCKLTGAEAAMAVNNNAAAVVLCLSALAKNKEVIVSRGQLVEIGGSFRIPEVMEQSGAKLVEVGATNKTHLRDYKAAIGQETALLLKVHTSNYRICGFTAEVSLEELSELGREHNIPIMDDIGSGVFINLEKYGLSHEPTVRESIEAGADIVTFSGDKLLGGPQAGMIVGKKCYIDKIKKHPLTRAVRIDKLSLAALEATLNLYIDEEKAIKEIPTLNMLTLTEDQLLERAQLLYDSIDQRVLDIADIQLRDDFSTVGGGSMPLETIPTKVISINTFNSSVDSLEKKLRMLDIPIFTRIAKDRLIIDVRTITKEEIPLVAEGLVKAMTV